MAKRGELSDTQIKIAIARGCGLTIERAGELIGCSTSTVYNHLDSPDVKALIAFARLCSTAVIDRQVEINTAAMKREWERRRTKALSVVDSVMERVDDSPALALKAAENVFDRADGKPTQTLRNEINSAVTVTYSIDRDILDLWQRESRELVPVRPLSLQPPSAIDADVIG